MELVSGKDLMSMFGSLNSLTEILDGCMACGKPETHWHHYRGPLWFRRRPRHAFRPWPEPATG